MLQPIQLKLLCILNIVMASSLFLIAIAISICSVTASSLESSEENEKLTAIQPYIYENIVNETLANLSITLREYDPYFIQEAEYIINSSSINGEILAKNIQISGFANFIATNIKNDLTILPPGFKTTFNIKFEELKVTIPDYYINFMAVFVPFYGKGLISLVAKEINGGAYAQIQTSLAGKITIKTLEIKLNITKTDLHVTGILNNEPLSEIVSSSMTECFSEFVNLYNDRLGKLLGAKLVDSINNLLNPPKPESKNGLDEDDNSDSDSLEYDLEASSSVEEESIKVGPYNFRIKITV